MKKADVQIGGVYRAKVSDKVVSVRIDAEHRLGGWTATNLATNKQIRIKSAQRLRSRVSDSQTKAAAEQAESTPADEERCIVPRCSGAMHILFEDRPLCEKHWQVMAGDDHLATMRLRKRIEKATANQDDLVVVVPANEPPADNDGVAATVEAVEAGNLAEGITIPRPKRGQEDQQTGDAPRSELTLEEADQLAKKRRTRKPADGNAKPKRLSAIDAAAEVLREADEPMSCQALIETMAERGLWSSPGGRTPSATLYSAILREISKKGDEARFRKVERGRFAHAGNGR